jgi:hypothetical protein
MHFLMPHVFQSHRDFKEWFSNPLSGMVEGSQEYNESIIRRLHKVFYHSFFACFRDHKKHLEQQGRITCGLILILWSYTI